MNILINKNLYIVVFKYTKNIIIKIIHKHVYWKLKSKNKLIYILKIKIIYKSKYNRILKLNNKIKYRYSQIISKV